jgi:hypothetical protein
VTISRWQNAEDGAPRDRVDWLLRHEGHITEHALVGIEVRDRWKHTVLPIRLVIRAFKSDGEITAALGRWDETDGA